MNNDSSRLDIHFKEDETVLHVLLDHEKGNVIDLAMITEIRAVLHEYRDKEGLRSILFEGAGRHFSFGASVEEHRPGEVSKMLPEFHALFRELHDCGKVLMAAVRGQCLGGGLELAAFCHRVFSSPDSKFGNPEITLGVFAPIASVVLPLRIGQPAADDLLLTGRVVSSNEALTLCLVDQVADDPVQAALAWHVEHLVPLSAAALRHASYAARHRLRRDLDLALTALERLYLEDLMSTQDATEGIDAFLEKREPQWKHR